MHYLPEPKQEHTAIAKTAVLLVNLGTPDAPTPRAVRRYLKQFLSDPRVIEIPRALWLPILHGLVLNTRPRKSARKYASIWSSEGSPLKVHTERQAQLLRGYWGQSGRPDMLLMSFHGLPRYTLVRGDPYHLECHKTARLLAERLELAESHWQIAFQSRFGRTEWMQPYTASALADYGRRGV